MWISSENIHGNTEIDGQSDDCQRNIPADCRLCMKRKKDERCTAYCPKAVYSLQLEPTEKDGSWNTRELRGDRRETRRGHGWLPISEKPRLPNGERCTSQAEMSSFGLCQFPLNLYPFRSHRALAFYIKPCAFAMSHPTFHPQCTQSLHHLQCPLPYILPALSTHLTTHRPFSNSSTSSCQRSSSVSRHKKIYKSLCLIALSPIEYLVGSVVETVDHAMGRPTPSYFRGRALSRRPEHAKFTTFVTKVLTTAEVTTPTVLGALVYIDRAKPHLHIALEEWALERVFLGAVIVASKVSFFETLYPYLN